MRTKIICEIMKLVILLSCIAWAASEDPSPRSVNVALETSFLFEPKNVNENISFIKNIKDFLDKLYKILEPQAKLFQQQKFRTETEIEPKPERRFGFFEWIKNAGQSFLNMTGSKIEEAASVIQNEFSKGADAIKEIIPLPSYKAHGEESMDQFARTRGDDLKESIKTMLKDDNPALGDIAKNINAYYTEDEVKKLHKLLRKFNKYIEADMDASKVVKEILQVVFLDKYKGLNDTAKANLAKNFELIRDYVKANKRNKFKDQNQQSTTSKRLVLPEVQLLFGEKVNPAAESTQPQIDANKDLRRSERKKQKKDEKKKGANPNEIIVDNLELIIKALKP